MLNRRDLFRLAGGLLAPSRASPSAGLHFEYRAKASVLLLSIPLWNRDHVGAGFLRVNESERDGCRLLRLEFGAGSIPERAAGLDRMGLFEESIVEQDGQLHSADYFGFMTSSPEENLDEAQAALKRGTASGISAIRGRIENGRIVNRLTRLTGLRHAGWTKWREVKAEVRERSEREAGIDVLRAASPGQPVSTFLYAVRAAMRDTAPATRNFVHNGEILRLHTDPSPDRASGVVCVTGRISKSTGKRTASFKLWHEAGAQPVPVRFEFRPRSFLRLAFERVSS